MFLSKVKFIAVFSVCISFAYCSSDDGDENISSDSLINNSLIEEVITPTVTEITVPENRPVSNLDLEKWNISIPIDRGDGISTNISVASLIDGYEHSDYFYASEDDGVVFKCPIDAPKTSSGTKFARTELREMLRGTNTNISTQGVNKNNWVFGTAPESDLAASGGVDGVLEATLAVNFVTTTGSSSQVGRVIIGQIHANDDEPCRLYYRKLPNNTKGGIYYAHEPADGFGNEIYINIIGDRGNSASDPEDGIALDERFSYVIETVGDILTVTIKREGKADVSRSTNMENSGYTSGGQYQYFKAGVYNQNNTGDADDYVQATFYDLKQSH